VPSVASLADLHRAVAGFTVEDLGLVIEPRALAAAERSLDESGLLLLGEVHGARENPLLIRAVITSLGIPLGARLAQQRPGVREIRIRYGGGRYYNVRPARFRRVSPPRDQVRLHDRRGALVLYLPEAREAVVPQRPGPDGGPP
jgi:hypothetical protein